MTPLNRRMGALVLSLLAVAGLASGCASGRGYYDTLCVNPLTQVRVVDVGCPGPWLYYVPVGYFAPAYGVTVVHYSATHYTRPASASIHTGGIPATGGKAPKLTIGNTTTSKSGKVDLTKPGSNPAAPKVNAPKVNAPAAPKVNAPAPRPAAPKAPSVGGGRK